MIGRTIDRRGFVGGALAALMASPTAALAGRAAEAVPAGAPLLDPGIVLSAQLRLGRRLVRHLARGNSSNVVVSPAGLAAVLVLLSSGASRPFGRAIGNVLGVRTATRTPAGEGIAALNAAIGYRMGRAQAPGPLTLANMIVLDPASRPYPEALARLAANGTDVSVEDLGRLDTVRRINDWIAGRTHGLIPSILDEPLPGAGLVALNALHFKDSWKQPFDAAQTRAQPFHRVGGGQVAATMMQAPAGTYRFRQDARFIAAELAYAHDDFRLVVVTTKSTPSRPGWFASVAGWLDGGGFTQGEGSIALPKLQLTGNAELLPVLDAMGLAPARRERSALARLAATPPTLARIVQKTELRMDEHGTEAAAATAAIGWRSLPSGSFTRMIVDRPFLFALRDRRTGLVLLSGYVAEPV